METSFGTIIFIIFVFCYFIFGIKGATRFVDNNMSKLLCDPKKCWLRYVLIAIAALLFAYIEFARLIILAILKLVRIITGG